MDWPVIVCVILATGVIVTPRQGSGGGGGGGVGVVSDFEQPEKNAVSIIAAIIMVYFMVIICTINLVF